MSITRKYVQLIRIVGTLSVLMFAGCDTYVPDPIDPRLPKYTEVGSNVAGALINDGKWVSGRTVNLFRNDEAPLIISYVSADSLQIIFHGISERYTTIEFNLSNVGVNSMDDLVLLHDKKITLDGTLNAAACRPVPCFPGNDDCESMSGIGQIHIRHARNGQYPDEFILSGTFGFTVNDLQTGNIRVSYGRFDYLIREGSNFIVQ